MSEHVENKWFQEDTLVYLLHHRGYRKDQPRLTNRFWLNVQGSKSEGVTQKELIDIATRIKAAMNLVEDISTEDLQAGGLVVLCDIMRKSSNEESNENGDFA